MFQNWMFPPAGQVKENGTLFDPLQRVTYSYLKFRRWTKSKSPVIQKLILILMNAVFWKVTLCGSCNNRSLRDSVASIVNVKIISELETLSVTSN
jgi:hypothetical protein